MRQRARVLELKQTWLYDAKSSSSAFASFRSRVSNLSVNHPLTRQVGRAITTSVDVYAIPFLGDFEPSGRHL